MLAFKPGFHQIVTRSWNRTIQACFDLTAKRLMGICGNTFFFYKLEPTWVRLML